MKKIMILAICAATALCGNAQLLWKISGGNQADSYLMATHHLAPISVLDSVPSVKSVLKTVDKVCGEINATDTQELLRRAQQAIMLPREKTLDNLITDKSSVDAAMRQYLGFGLDNPMAQRLKPVGVSSLLAAALYAKSLPGYNNDNQLDIYFQTKALKAGKPVIALETVEQQIKLLFDTPLERQARHLECLCQNIDWNLSEAEMLNDAYLQQDLATLDQVMIQTMGDGCDPEEDEAEELLADRNREWMTQIPAIMNEGSTLFVVGAGHLTGKEGLLELLCEQGYKLTPMDWDGRKKAYKYGE